MHWRGGGCGRQRSSASLLPEPERGPREGSSAPASGAG